MVDLVSGNITQFKADANNENSIRSNNITALFTQSKSELWLGYRGEGLTHIDRQTGEHTHYQNIKDNEKISKT